MKLNYSSRDYASILSEINSDPVLKEHPSFLKSMVAGVFDVLNNTLNAIVNAIIPSTFYSRPIASDVLKLIDYELSWKSTSETILDISIDPSATLTESYTIPKEELKFSTSTENTDIILNFESRSDVTFSIGTSTTSITVYQQTTQDESNIGSTDGTSFQLVNLPFTDIIKDTVKIIINSIEYTLVDSFASYTENDYVYRIYYRTDGSSYIVLGGIDSKTLDQYGFIPESGIPIFLNCATGGGINSNTGIDTIVQYTGNDSNILDVSTPIPATGGRDEESLSNASIIAPLHARTCEYFVNESTGIYIAKKNPSIQDAQIKKSGLLAVDCWIIPTGGGVPSTDLKNSIKSELESKSVFGEVSVNMIDPSYVELYINASIISYPNFSKSLIERYSKLALVYRISEISKLIKESFYSTGIEQAISLINAYLSAYTGDTYTATDYIPIEKIIRNIPVQTIGESFYKNDLVMALSYVSGIDTVIINNPSDTIILPGSISKPSGVVVSVI